MVSEKNLSRQQSSIQQITEQQQTPLKFQRTPGFGTVKRRDRRQAARKNHSPYKPPKKPNHFKPFSPEKKQQITSSKQIPLCPSTPIINDNNDKPSFLQSQSTVLTTPIQTAMNAPSISSTRPQQKTKQNNPNPFATPPPP
eukprot:411846_1